MLVVAIILIVVGLLVGGVGPRYGPGRGYAGYGYGIGGALVLIGVILLILALLGVAL